jgi:hypothetical protein
MTNLIPDDPTKDNTTDAHPAWHRGKTHGSNTTSLALEQIAMGTKHVPGDDGFYNAAAGAFAHHVKEKTDLQKNHNKMIDIHKILRKELLKIQAANPEMLSEECKYALNGITEDDLA